MASCGFSNGFSSGWNVCVAEEPAQQGGSGSGAGLVTTRRRRRLRKVALEGFGLVSILGTAELTIQPELAGAGAIVIKGAGVLEADDERTAVMLLLGVPDA